MDNTENGFVNWNILYILMTLIYGWIVPIQKGGDLLTKYAIRIHRDSHFNYLALMYFLPEDFIVRCPTLRSLPRCFGEIAKSDKLIDVINSDVFLSEIMDAMALLAFPHFGFSGWKEHYTGDFPPWKLSYSLSLWSMLLEDEVGWSIQRLFQIPASENIPFFEPTFITEVMEKVVKRGITEQGWQPMLDVVKQMPCDEDFERYDTNVRKDFLRKWYHTRSKNVQTVSLEACMENEEHGVHEVEDVSSRFEDQVAGEDYVQKFKERLSEKDYRILGLRAYGFTHQEIAKIVPYKNHSGVIKRIRAIMKECQKYEEEQQR